MPYSRETLERLKQDPSWVERRRLAAREAKQREMANPGKRKRVNERWLKRAKERYASDPDHREKLKHQSRARAARKKSDDPVAWQAENSAKSLKAMCKRLGMTIEQYVVMEESQDGCCAICGRPETIIKRHKVCRLAIDHDHETGEVRGLLCSNCNRGLGMFKDSPNLLWAAANYLIRHNLDLNKAA